MRFVCFKQDRRLTPRKTMSEYQQDMFEPYYVYVVVESSDDSLSSWVYEDLVQAHKKARKEMKEWYDSLDIDPNDESVCKSEGWDQGSWPATISIEQEPYPWIKITRQEVNRTV